MSDAAASGKPPNAASTVLLVGNPNVGKSVLFKNLTNHYVTVSNYPGTTVEIVRAKSHLIQDRPFEVVDTPGINDLSPRTDEGRVSRDIIEGNPAATLVQVSDAKNLRRALLLTLQLGEMGRPLVLVLNMSDELEEIGAQIDAARLSEILGVPVVSTVAVRGTGTRELVEAIESARPPHVDSETLRRFPDGYERNCARMEQVNRIMAETYRVVQPKNARLGVRLGFWATHPVKGLLFLSAVLLVMFWFVGLLGAGTLVDTLETALFAQRVNPLVVRGVDRLLPFPHQHAVETIPYTLALPLTPIHQVQILDAARDAVVPAYSLEAATTLTGVQRVMKFLHDFLVGEYGLVTMALSYALAIVFPIVTTFFLLFSVLEDSGYLPRLSIMVNRLFRLMGLNGKAVLPMVLGLGCDTMATMTTRILETRKERIVTTMLLALAVPCSAQLGVLLAMMASISFGAAVFWLVLIAAIMVLTGWLTSRLFPGGPTDFILEIPPLRTPQLSNVLIKTFSRLEWYLKEVIPLFLLGTAILFFLDKLNVLEWLSTLGEPLVKGWLGLPRETSGAFLIGFLRRDFGAVYLLDAATGPNPVLSAHQILVAMVTITLFMPCIATFFMVAKEHGQKVAWAMTAFIFPFAFLVGGLVHHLGWIFGV